MKIFRRSITWRILTAQLVTALTISLVATLAATYSSLQTLRERQIQGLESFMMERTERVRGLFEEISTAHAMALTGLEERLERLSQVDADREFETLFPQRGDGSRRSTDRMFDGFIDPQGDYHRGVAAYMAPATPADAERRRLLVAAYSVVDRGGEMLGGEVQNIYFFSPDNELIISAAQREDQMMFYRYEADPAEFNLSASDFAQLVLPENNPQGRFICAELSQLVSVQTREALTTGCFTPVRMNGEHVGALGTTLQISNWFAEALATREDGVHRVFLGETGDLLAHSAMFDGDVTQDRVDEVTQTLGIENVFESMTASGRLGQDGVVTSTDNQWVVAFDYLEGPGWHFATLVDQSNLTREAWRDAAIIMGFGAIGIALQALVLYALIFGQVIKPIQRLARGFGGDRETSAGSAQLADLRDEDGEIGALARTLEHQQALNERNLEELECRVAERTEALEKANRVKSEFLSNMSHELRTPLNGIYGLAQAMENELPDEKTKSLARMIKTSGETLTLLLNDILDMSKIEAGRLELALKAGNIRELLEETHALFEEQARAAGIEFTLRMDDSLPTWGLIDALRLRQILSNLISNALKFTSEGGVYLSASARAEGKRHRVRIDVRDTGIGMSDDVQARLFTPFTQADSDTATRFGGTGLGLYISRSLAELMKGQIAVVSSEGDGSVFTLEFDMASVEREDTTHATATPAELAGREEFALLRNLNILLVEDNAINRQVAKAFLKPLTDTVIEAENGQIALDKLKTEPVDLVLMDVRMPVMGGFEATTAIREAEANYATLPIVALTANAGEDDARACFDIGMDAFASKPLTPLALFEAMKQAVEIRSGERDALII
ncbi:MAG: response regulator [Alphaproteobacteria bacterium]|nr:response regulator [Alphaproteobacteria bacterium]